MVTPMCSGNVDEIVGHFLRGEPLSAEAREHYLSCEDCMIAVTAALSANLSDAPIRARGATPRSGAAEGRTATLPEPARLARDHGRQVLKRVFGIGEIDDAGSA